MPLMQGYYFSLAGPDVVEIHEEETSYRMSRDELLKAIQTVRSQRAEFATDEAFRNASRIYEDALYFLHHPGE